MRLISWLMAGMAAGGYLVYRRSLQQNGQRKSVGDEPAVQHPVQAPREKRASKLPGKPEKKGSAAGKAASLDKRVAGQIKKNPGILQTELYGLFPGIARKRLQSLLLRLDRQGVLQRTPEKGTYRLSLTG